MPSGVAQLTTTGLFHVSQNLFSAAANQCADGDLNNGTANIAIALMRLNQGLLAELTQMSQDVATLKAEVASLKAKPTGLQFSSQAAFARK